MSFYVGQKVVCVDASGQAGVIAYGSTYTVKRIHDCGSAQASIHVGAGYNDSNWSGFTMCDCGCRIRGTWHRSTRFRPLDALTEQIDRIESEGAPVEQPEPAFA